MPVFTTVILLCVTKWRFWPLDEILYIADFKKFSQYPTFRVMIIDLATHAGTCFPSVYCQGSWKSFFSPPATTPRRQWLLGADTAMKCYMSSQTQEKCFVCQVLSSSPAASLTSPPSSNHLITFFKEISRSHLSYCIKGTTLIFHILLPLTQMNWVSYSWDKMCSGFKHNCPLLGCNLYMLTKSIYVSSQRKSLF